MKFVAVILGLCSLMAFGQKQQAQFTYNYRADLSKIKDDKLKVTLEVPSWSKNEAVFRMPKIIPGTYEILDFGRFVTDFKAFDASGKELKVEHPDVNTWRISGAKNLAKITYHAMDVWDSKVDGPPVFEPAGTSFEKDEYLLNTHTLFGYFDGHKTAPYVIEIDHPAGVFGSTGLSSIRAGKTQDIIKTGTYMELVDSPIMYTKPDTVNMNIGGCNVLVTVVSPKGIVKAKEIGEQVRGTLEAQKNYLGGKLPVKKYAFLIYLFSGNSGSGGYGALEHSYSSVYFLPEMPGKRLGDIIVETAAHEFFHIVTPLSIHSNEIHDFNYMTDVMSKHLWLYEGVVEYFAHHVLVTNKLNTVDKYLGKVEAQINDANSYRSDISFTEMSKGCTRDYVDEYLNVYQKGALIGMALDIELLHASNGKYNLRSLIADLSKRYGKDKAFHDDSLFNVIERMTYPSVGKFLRTYVDGTTPLPLKETFDRVGVEYVMKDGKPRYGLGGVGLGADSETGLLMITDLSHLNAFGKSMGYQRGDVFLKVNKQHIRADNFMEVITDLQTKTKEGQKMTFEMGRLKDGEFEIIKLKGKAKAVPGDPTASLKLMESPGKEALELREKWLSVN